MTTAKTASPKVFIDGDAGTTGLQIVERLKERTDITLLQIDPAQRKSEAARAALLAQADVAILCLPDDAARRAVELAPANTRILDASTAHRTQANWVYGFPELAEGQRERIAQARWVANPGCYPTGAIALVRPLVDAGILNAGTTALTVNAVSGYSGGGKAMIAKFEAPGGPSYELYGLNLQHKHVPEMQLYSGLSNRPLFAPAAGNFYAGMLVSVPLLTGKGNGSANHIRDTLAQRYRDEPFVRVMPQEAIAELPEGRLHPDTLVGTNNLELFVFGSDSDDQALLVARLDNLGKGASGAAVQNLNLMLGLPETIGLN